MSATRFSNRSLREYACSTPFPTACASAISHTSRGMSVRSAAYTRNDVRKPCIVESPAIPVFLDTFIRLSGAMDCLGFVADRKIRSDLSLRRSASSSTAIVDFDSDTRCGFHPFILSTGIFHITVFRSTSLWVLLKNNAPCGAPSPLDGNTQDKKKPRNPLYIAVSGCMS